MMPTAPGAHCWHGSAQKAEQRMGHATRPHEPCAPRSGLNNMHAVEITLGVWYGAMLYVARQFAPQANA